MARNRYISRLVSELEYPRRLQTSMDSKDGKHFISLIHHIHHTHHILIIRQTRHIPHVHPVLPVYLHIHQKKKRLNDQKLLR
jgi:hypothetical protein